MIGGEPSDQIRLRLFISYSRSDEDFAQDLLAGLEVGGFEPYLDKRDIVPGEDWQVRLGRLIEAADTIVFVISPESIASERCAWEVDCAIKLHKRLLPVVWRRVDEASVPSRLSQLNYVFFDQPQSFGASLRTLTNALRTDIQWVREHTRIGEAALRWDARGRVEAMLLRGEELVAARDWLSAQPVYAAKPTLLHHEFIKASEDAEALGASVERMRLNEMAAVQDERAVALEREKFALAREDAALREAQAAMRKRQMAQIAASAFLVCIIAGLVGWINQATIRQQLNWHFVMRPHMNANFLPYVLNAAAAVALAPGKSFRECANNCPEMIVVPAGQFTMGSGDAEVGRDKDEGPQHQVNFAHHFAVSKFPVTFEEWNACVRVGGCLPLSDSGFGEGNRPVINVSWDEAKLYVEWLSLMTGKNYRLLSEAEWEYAARAGSTSRYFWGDDIGKGNANCIGCGSDWDNKMTSPVGSFMPNAFGLYDMHGNIWQWLEDCYHDTYEGAPADGRPWTDDCPQSRRTVRGGGWDSYAINIRAANRDRISTGNRLNDLGFRVARPMTETAIGR